MLTITPQMKIFIAVDPVDFRNGIDGLVAICKKKLEQEPFSGALFVFRNRRRIAVKCLAYDGQGFWLAMKRLSEGRFRHWPESSNEKAATIRMAAHELQILLWNGNPQSSQVPPYWKKITG
jgi:transposase